MPGHKAARLFVGLSAALAVLGMAVSADAQEKKIKIGVIYDLTGPLAGGGSELQYIGAKNNAQIRRDWKDAPSVLADKNFKYVFRPQASGDQFGMMTMDFIAQNAKAKLGKDPKDLRVAIIHEDGAYGVDVSKGNEAGAK